MPCEPGTPLEATPCATRPPPARPARYGGFLFFDTLPACRRPEPVHCGFSGCFALVLRVRADMPRRGWGSAIVTSFLFECTWRGAPPPHGRPATGNPLNERMHATCAGAKFGFLCRPPKKFRSTGSPNILSCTTTRTSSGAALRAIHLARVCRPHLAENSPLESFPGARCPRGEG